MRMHKRVWTGKRRRPTYNWLPFLGNTGTLEEKLDLIVYIEHKFFSIFLRVDLFLFLDSLGMKRHHGRKACARDRRHWDNFSTVFRFAEERNQLRNFFDSHHYLRAEIFEFVSTVKTLNGPKEKASILCGKKITEVPLYGFPWNRETSNEFCKSHFLADP